MHVLTFFLDVYKFGLFLGLGNLNADKASSIFGVSFLNNFFKDGPGKLFTSIRIYYIPFKENDSSIGTGLVRCLNCKSTLCFLQYFFFQEKKDGPQRGENVSVGDLNIGGEYQRTLTVLRIIGFCKIKA